MELNNFVDLLQKAKNQSYLNFESYMRLILDPLKDELNESKIIYSSFSIFDLKNNTNIPITIEDENLYYNVEERRKDLLLKLKKEGTKGGITFNSAIATNPAYLNYRIIDITLQSNGYTFSGSGTLIDTTSDFILDKVIQNLKEIFFNNRPLSIRLYRPILDNSINCTILLIKDFNYDIKDDVIFWICDKLATEYGFRRELVTSSISAIMARNMSHNIGSHVITNTKAQIERMAEKHSNIQQDLYGLSKLMHYIQERQDFISVLASGEQYAKGPVNLKNHIFDFIAYDGPALRHSSSAIRNFFLDNIIRSEEYERNGSKTIELKIQFDQKKPGKTIVHSLSSKRKNDNEAQVLSNINFAIPYGINGRQAFLTIIENFIRNSAKHLKHQLKNELLVTISVVEEDNNYRITIFDNKENFDHVINNINKSYECLSRVINIDGPKYAILPGSLKIVNPEGKLDHYHKGLKEMLICIAWLKGKNSYSCIEEDPSKELNMHFVGVPVDRDPTLKSFGIEFGLEKFLPQQELMITEKPTDATKGNLNDNDLHDDAILNKFIKGISTADIYLLKGGTEEHRKILRKYLTRIQNLVDKTDPKPEVEKIEEIKNTDLSAAFYLNRSLIENTSISAFDRQILVIDKGTDDPENKSTEEKWLRENDYLVKASKESDDTNNSNQGRRPEPEFEQQIRAFLEENKIENDLLVQEINALMKTTSSVKSESTTVDVQNSKITRDFYLFRTHYETMDSGQQFLEISGSCKFLEGISGGNYTHTLIRNSDFTLKHFIKLAESCETRIAIIDERLFDKYKDPPKEDDVIIEENNKWGSDEDYQKLLDWLPCPLLDKDKINLAEYVSRGDDRIAIEKFVEIVKGYSKIEPVLFCRGELSSFKSYKRKLFTKLCKEDTKRGVNIDEFKDLFEGIVNIGKEEDTRRNWGTYFAGKNVFLYTLETAPTGIDPNESGIASGTGFKTFFVKNPSTPIPFQEITDQAHFVSVHYSLIEKLCENSKANNKNETQESVELSKLKELFKSFNGKVAVHSGRGDLHKFGEDKVAFLPLSSIEWALENSKYMLTELFYNTKYFPHN